MVLVSDRARPLRARHVDLCVNIQIFAEQGQRFAVEPHRDIGKPACASRAHFVRAIKRKGTRTRQRQFLILRRRDFKI